MPVSYSDVDDQELVSLAVEGRQRAYREILSRYEGPVFSLIYRMVRNRTLAEDLAQETFIRAFQAIRRYDPSYKFSNWIFKIAHNHAIDHFRKRKLKTVSMHGSPHAATEEEASRTGFELESRTESPLEYVEARELGDRIEAAIGELRPEYRSVVLLRHIEGYSYEESSRILEVPLGTVKTYLHRARVELKERLDGWDDR